MPQTFETTTSNFLDRRSYDVSQRTPIMERRQFADSVEGLAGRPGAGPGHRPVQAEPPPPLHHL